jgi:hypothetical protein
MGVDQDEVMLNELRRIAAAADGPPTAVLEAARAAFLTRDLDTEIADLIADSRASSAYEQVRAAEAEAEGQWLLSFEGGGIHIDLEVDSGGLSLRLVGMLSGVQVEECVLQAEGHSRPVALDRLGRFILDDLAPGPIRMRCRLSDGRRVMTRWVRI